MRNSKKSRLMGLIKKHSLQAQKFGEKLEKMESMPLLSHVKEMLKKDGFVYKGTKPMYADANGSAITKGLPEGIIPPVVETWVHPDDLSVVRIEPLGHPTGTKDSYENYPHIHFESMDIEDNQTEIPIRFEVTGDFSYD